MKRSGAGPAQDPGMDMFAIDRRRLRVTGVDEAGRGPLAGPVAVAAVILDPRRRLRGLDDSKKLTRAQREALYPRIVERALKAIDAGRPSSILERAGGQRAAVSPKIICEAAEAGEEGDPGQYRDYLLPPPRSSWAGGRKARGA